MNKMQIAFMNNSFDDYMEWVFKKQRTANKINALINNIMFGRSLKGKGKSQKFKTLPNTYSLKIDDKNDLVYCIRGNVLEIKSCKGHYDD